MHDQAATPPTEIQLVQAARTGDRTAFARLVRDCGPMLERLALRMLGQPADAEDVTQEAVLYAWRSVSGFRGEARFRTWLHRILVSRALDRIRARREYVEVPQALASDHIGPAAQASAREFENVARGAIDGLPPTQRATLLLRMDQGMSYDEIAYVLGSTRNAVRSNLIAARKRLAEKLRKHAELGGGDA